MSGVAPQIPFSPDPEAQKHREAGEIPELCLSLVGMLMVVILVLGKKLSCWRNIIMALIQRLGKQAPDTAWPLDQNWNAGL